MGLIHILMQNIWVTLIVLVVIAIGLLVLSKHLSRAKCPKCKKRNCAIIGQQETSRQTVMFKEQETIKTVDNKHNLYGNVNTNYSKTVAQFGSPASTTIRTHKVPGERIHYLVTYQCNICNHNFRKNIYVDSKPPTVG